MGLPEYDGSADVSSGDEGSNPEASTVDATMDATADALPPPDAAETSTPPTLLTLVGVDDGNTPRAGAYVSGKWTVSAIGSDVYSPVGGGVAILSASDALASLRGNANTSLETATYGGTWSKLSLPGPTGVSYVGPPVATATGAALLYQSGVGAYTLYAARYSSATKTWTTTSESLGVQGDNETVPWLVETSSGELALYATTSGNYASVSQSAGTWAAQELIPGATAPQAGLGSQPSIAGVRRAGTNDVVAAWVTGGASLGKASITTGVWSAGAWTVAGAALATDVANSQERPFAMAALPDGRVALAYVSTAAVKLALYDGTSWGPPSTVPGPVTSLARVPVAVAPGIDGSAVIELAYLDANRHPQHTRLTSEMPVTWSAAQAIDSANAYDAIDLASGP